MQKLTRNRNLRSTSHALVVLLLAAACTPATSDNSALVVDEAELLDKAQRERIATFHRLLQEDYDIDYRVVTNANTGDIDTYAASRFEQLGVGAASARRQGLLLVVDPLENRVRLEVGYALEGTFPDAFIAYVEQRQMVPFFQAGRVADGILATTELIVSRADKALSSAGLESEVPLAGSGGAGAATAARLNSGSTRTYAEGSVAAGATPEATLATYFAAMQQRDGNPGLDIYSPATQRMLADWVMTPAQMDNIVKTYRNCEPEPPRIDPQDKFGVIRYPLQRRLCAPWFFEKTGNDWTLDLTMMQRAIRFGRDNSWHFERGADHPYQFAFTDWRLDAHGYPQASR